MLHLIIFVVAAYILFQLFIVVALVINAPKRKKEGQPPPKPLTRGEKWVMAIMAAILAAGIVGGLSSMVDI